MKVNFNILFLLWAHFTFSINGMALINDQEDISRIVFRVYGFEYQPSITAVKNSVDGNVTYKGSSVDFINYFADHLQFRLEYVPENLSEVAKIGQILASIQTVSRKEREVDFSSFPMSPSHALWQIMDFTTTTFEEPYQLLTLWPEEESRFTAAIRPFNLTTWISICVSNLVFVGFVGLLSFVYGCWNQGMEELLYPVDSPMNFFGKAIMYVIAVFTQHGADPRRIGISPRFSLRLMLGLWLLMTVILANLYMSTVTSFMTVVKLKPIPNSLEELITSFEQSHKECLITFLKDHPVLQRFNNTTYKPYKKLGKWVTKHPKFSTNFQGEIPDNIINHGCTHIGTRLAQTFMMGSDYKKYGKCRMTTSKPLDFSYAISYQLQKNSRFTSIINQHALQAASAGLFQHWRKRNSNLNMDKCKVDKKNDKEKVEPIKLIHLSSAFLVLSGGLSLGSLAFLLEKIFGKLLKKTNNR